MTARPLSLLSRAAIALAISFTMPAMAHGSHGPSEQVSRLYIQESDLKAAGSPEQINPTMASWVISQADTALQRKPNEDEPFTAGTADLYAHDVAFCAAAFRLTGKKSYAECGTERLLTAATHWKSNDPYVTSNNSLDFAIAILPMAFGFDLLRPELSNREIAKVQQRFFAPAAVAIRQNEYARDERQKRSNHRSWQNAAVGVLGLASNRNDLVDWAIADPQGGFNWQIENAFSTDGLQWEGSPRYQLYTMAALLYLAEAIERSGRPSLWEYRSPSGHQLDDIFYGLIDVAESNGRLPNVNARQQESLMTFTDFYAIAYRHARRPEYAWMAQQASNAPKADRPWTYGLDISLAFFPPPSSTGTAPSLDSDVHADIGWATLRVGSTTVMGASDPLYVLFKFSRFKPLKNREGSAHEHADKGLLEIRADGAQWAAARSRQDAGDTLYAGFDRQTVAKNTLVVDQKSQAGAASAFDSLGVNGELEYQSLQPAIKIVQGRVNAAYQLGYCRAVAVVGDPANDGLPSYVIDLFEARDQRTHTYDYVLRSGEDRSHFLHLGLSNFHPVSSELSAPGYRYLKDTAVAEVSDPFDIAWGLESKGLMLHVLPGKQKMQVFRSNAPGTAQGQVYPHVIFRRENVSQTVFRVIHEPFEQAPKLHPRLITDQDDVTAILIESPGARDWFIYRPHSDGFASAQLEGEKITINGRYGYVRIRSGSVTAEGDIVQARLKALDRADIAKFIFRGNPAASVSKDGFISFSSSERKSSTP